VGDTIFEGQWLVHRCRVRSDLIGWFATHRVGPAAITDQFRLIDYRLYDPDGDGKSRLDHVQDMPTNAVHHKRLPFGAVLMDTRYAARDLMLFIEPLGKVYYCPLKDNRQVDDSGGDRPYQRVDSLEWNSTELAHGKTVKIKGFPKHHKVRLFRVEVSTHRTDWVVTNDSTQDSAEATRQMCGFRWKIEQVHRGDKQVTGWNAANAARPAFNAATSVVPFWSGAGRSGNSLSHRPRTGWLSSARGSFRARSWEC
jgi:hypothetical protein